MGVQRHFFDLNFSVNHAQLSSIFLRLKSLPSITDYFVIYRIAEDRLFFDCIVIGTIIFKRVFFWMYQDHVVFQDRFVICLKIQQIKITNFLISQNEWQGQNLYLYFFKIYLLFFLEIFLHFTFPFRKNVR